MSDLVQVSGTVVGEVVGPAGGLADRAAAVAARQAAPATRRTYASVYRSFTGWLGPDAGAGDVDEAALLAWRDELERRGRTPSTVALHLSALRQLAMDLGADHAALKVRGQRVARGEPRAISREELERLLRMPDKRTTQGKRDLALLHLLASAGLRRHEAAAVKLGDVDEHGRVADGRMREAVAGSTSWWVTVAYGKRGRTRRVPLTAAALEAITAWVKARPATADELLLCSLPRSGGEPGPLSTRDVARIVEKHATAAGLPEDRRSPHVLRHTFCTQLAAAGVGVEVIRLLAGHADIRTTTIYTAIDDGRLEAAIAGADQARHGARRLGASR